MSGVAGAERIRNRADFAEFLISYQNLISKFLGFVNLCPSGSYNSDLFKQDFGDMDLIVHIQSDRDKSQVKRDLQEFLISQPPEMIVPFSSERYLGRRSYNAGELITVRYHDQHLGYSIQIDNIVALSAEEADFKLRFLNIPAEKQGLILGLVKIATIETPVNELLDRMGIEASTNIAHNQEYEFNLSGSEFSLRLVTYHPGTFKQESRSTIWSSNEFANVTKLLYQYDLDSDFLELLSQCQYMIRNPRSHHRVTGIFNSMITVKSGELGTIKGYRKQLAQTQIQEAFR